MVRKNIIKYISHDCLLLATHNCLGMFSAFENRISRSCYFGPLFDPGCNVSVLQAGMERRLFTCKPSCHDLRKLIRIYATELLEGDMVLYRGGA